MAWFAPVAERLQWVAEPGHDVDLLALSSDGTRLAYTINANGYSHLVLRALEDGRESRLDLKAN